MEYIPVDTIDCKFACSPRRQNIYICVYVSAFNILLTLMNLTQYMLKSIYNWFSIRMLLLVIQSKTPKSEIKFSYHNFHVIFKVR